MRDLCRDTCLFSGGGRAGTGPLYHLLPQKDTLESEGRTLSVTIPEEQVETWTFPGRLEHMVTLIRIYFS